MLMILGKTIPSIFTTTTLTTTTTTTAPMALASPLALATSTFSSSLVFSALPKLPLLLAASSSTALFQQPPGSNSDAPLASQQNNNNTSNNDETDDETSSNKRIMLSPRARSCIWMAVAMSLHFGGYEFARSGALALFTSSETGFSHPSAYPFAIGLVTPVSLVLLYWYGTLLKAHGPRYALRTTKWMSVLVLSLGPILLRWMESGTSTIWTKALVGMLFVFQNSYAHLIYTQQWSFLGSIMTPTEGTKWFSAIAGICSIVCSITATMVHRLAALVGLLGLVLGTAGTLFVSLLLADRAYQLGEKVCTEVFWNIESIMCKVALIPTYQNGFDPSEVMASKTKTKPNDGNKVPLEDKSLLVKTAHLFQRVPTLAALFGEVISFQSLSTVLNVCFVRQLKDGVPLDTDRASFTGRFYAYINGVSALMQFFVLPLTRNYLEPKWVYRLMPVMLLPLLLYSSFQVTSLWTAAVAFFALKTMDYSLRNVVNEMVYQPLDFDSRYLGKEVIGVFANRFGKSGMSMILSFLTPLGVGITQLSQIAVGVASLWSTSSVWLSRTIVTNAEAERLVRVRQKEAPVGKHPETSVKKQE